MTDDLSSARVPLRQLLFAICQLGLTSLGGWPSYYHDSFVLRRRWLSDSEYLEGAAISTLVPGPTFTNFTIFAAHRLNGWLAVVIGLLLVLVPGALAMLILGSVYGSAVVSTPPVQLALQGLGAGAAALVIVTLVRLLRAVSLDRVGLAIAAAAFVALGPLGLSLFLVVPPLVVVGVMWERSRQRAVSPPCE
jgi:chromate transporter